VDIGQHLRAARKAAGLTQEGVARRAGLTLKAVGEVERGEVQDPHYSTLIAIARALNITVAELIEEPEASTTGKASAPPDTGPSEADLEQRREHSQRLMDAGVSEATARELAGEYSRSEEYWRALAQHVGIEPPTWVAPGVDLEQLHDLGIPVNASEANIVNLCIGAPPSASPSDEVGKSVVDETRVFALLAYVLLEGMLTEDEIEVARETLRRKLRDESEATKSHHLQKRIDKDYG
jgi:transcriptional regulator with XRE-family HTH domain